MSGLDAAKIDQLPNSVGMHNEVLLNVAQRTNYNHATEVPGGHLIVVGEPDGATQASLEAAMSDKTSYVPFVRSMLKSRLVLEEVIAAANASGITVL
jgi:hypothetical protein